jgi:phospholipid transport system substrate-binding protein
MRQVLIAFFISLLLAAPSWSGDTQDALQLAEQTSAKMIAELQGNRERLQQEPQQVYKLVEDILLPHFDFQAMARWVMGKYWRQADENQQQRFTQEFRTLLINTYANALLEYSNEAIHFYPLQSAQADETTVRSEIRLTSGSAIPINYSMHVRDNDWKVYDVVIDGVSLVTNYRSTLGGQIRDEGIDAVIQKISERNGRGA